MALVRDAIKGDIKSAFTAVMNQEGDDRMGAIDALSGKIADAVVNAINSMEINYTGGLVAPDMGGPITGAFGYQIT